MSDTKRPQIKPASNGPLLVEGMDQIVRYTDGKAFEGGKTTALCRCGGSKNKPFCDGTHGAIGFTDAKDPNRVPVPILTVLFIVAPVVHPWYVCWVVPFLAVFPSIALFGLIAGVPLSYHTLAGWETNKVWRELGSYKLAAYTPFYAFLAITAWNWLYRLWTGESVKRRDLGAHTFLGVHHGPRRGETILAGQDPTGFVPSYLIRLGLPGN